MIYTSEAIERIITSASAKEAITYISPIYANAERFLYILNAIGMELDQIVEWSNDLWEEMFPNTASWSLGLWEQEYGLRTDATQTTARRRELLMAKILSRRQMNTERMEQYISSVAGVGSRVEAHVSKNKFSVYLRASSSENESIIRAAIARVKPAHLIYELLYEQYMTATQYIGGVCSVFMQINAKQAY